MIEGVGNLKIERANWRELTSLLLCVLVLLGILLPISMAVSWFHGPARLLEFMFAGAIYRPILSFFNRRWPREVEDQDEFWEGHEGLARDATAVSYLTSSPEDADGARAWVDSATFDTLDTLVSFAASVLAPPCHVSSSLVAERLELAYRLRAVPSRAEILELGEEYEVEAIRSLGL